MRLYNHAHAMGEFREGKVVCVCSECGVELDEKLCSPIPCTIPTSSIVVDEDGNAWFINVWNCRAELLVETPGGEYRRIEAGNEALAAELEERVLQAVDEQGAINISGHYSVPDELFEFVREGLCSGRLNLAE